MKVTKLYILLIAIVVSLTLPSCATKQLAEREIPVTGGWSKYMGINTDEMAVFQQATAQLIGVTYHPTEVSKQVVSGMNYRFYCTATPATRNPKSYQATIQIYAPINGNPPTVTHIESLSDN